MMTKSEKKAFFEGYLGKYIGAETMALMIKLAAEDIVLGWSFGPGWMRLDSVEIR